MARRRRSAWTRSSHRSRPRPGRTARRRGRHPSTQRSCQRIRPLRGRVQVDRRVAGVVVVARRPQRRASQGDRQGLQQSAPATHVGAPYVDATAALDAWSRRATLPDCLDPERHPRIPWRDGGRHAAGNPGRRGQDPQEARRDQAAVSEARPQPACPQPPDRRGSRARSRATARPGPALSQGPAQGGKLRPRDGGGHPDGDALPGRSHACRDGHLAQQRALPVQRSVQTQESVGRIGRLGRHSRALPPAHRPVAHDRRRLDAGG